MDQDSLYSIGHGNKTIEQLIHELRSFNIQYVVDVRSVPYSKYHPQFNREALMAAINATGDIRYGYMGNEIGGLPKDDSYKTEGKMDYDKMKLSPEFQHGLQRLIHANSQHLRTCIMCSESNPAECHRTKLIGEALREQGINLRHICRSPIGRIILKSQIDVINEVTKGNSLNDLFGAGTTFTSRKTY